MKRFVLLSITVTLLFTALPSTAQEVPVKAETVVLDTDGDGISDDVDACPSDVGPGDENPKKNGCTARVLARQWIVTFISKNAPPGRPTYFKYAGETREEALIRYGEIAESLLDVIYDPEIKPMFAGSHGRARTVSLLLGVMLWETGFRRDVDFGLGKYARGDNGRSWCLMQINLGKGKTASGYTGQELVSNRRLCFSEGLKSIRGSFSACRGLPLEYRLSAYASGSCDKGRDKSKQRVGTGMQWYTNSRALRLFKDDEIIPRSVEEAPASKEPTPLVALTG
jgi:hypothetical protein